MFEGFEKSEVAEHFAFDGESLVDICGAIFTDPRVETDLMKLGGFYSKTKENLPLSFTCVLTR